MSLTPEKLEEFLKLAEGKYVQQAGVIFHEVEDIAFIYFSDRPDDNPKQWTNIHLRFPMKITEEEFKSRLDKDGRYHELHQQ